MRRMTLVLAVLLASTNAWASVHWVIISTVRTSPKSMARINVAGTEPDVVRFTVFNAVMFPIFDEMPLSSSFFVTSASSDLPEIQNFFNIYPDQPGMVQVLATQVHTEAILEQSSPEGKVILSVPPVDEARGIKFLVPIGELHQGTSLLIGNPSDQPAPVAIRYGLNPLQRFTPDPVPRWRSPVSRSWDGASQDRSSRPAAPPEISMSLRWAPGLLPARSCTGLPPISGSGCACCCAGPLSPSSRS